MIEINLLPEEIRKKKRQSPKIDAPMINVTSLPAIGIAASAVGVILVIQLALFAMGAITGVIFKKINSEYKDILPRKLETEKLKIQVDMMNKKVAAIDELMVKRFSWEQKLNSLSDSMIPGIWLTDLEYDEKITEIFKPVDADPSKKKSASNKKSAEKLLTRFIVISGAASSMGEEGTALIGRFIKSLKDNPEFYFDFSDIELGTIRREKMEDQEIMTFKITCFLKAMR